MLSLALEDTGSVQKKREKRSDAETMVNIRHGKSDTRDVKRNVVERKEPSDSEDTHPKRDIEIVEQ